ncbi:DUF255 domain-containing protein [Nocardia huaxiensis]|uniref:DUF255 domain-containing protein n=1 Tax=Nocardia huaxiensis TaxID=2755382 RepID=A0A7D6ZNZ3_9NOCA|nr:DUF255 domain-containing protein [Nocardia huaxiensis]
MRCDGEATFAILTSPYLWAEAAARDVPILLSIGYASCRWCHVMVKVASRI